LEKGLIQYTVFVFDKASRKLNFDKIKNVLSSNPSTKEHKMEKIIISLFFSDNGEKFT
jgi:hypothetical protein